MQETTVVRKEEVVRQDRLAQLKERFYKEPLGCELGAELRMLRRGYAVISLDVQDWFLIVDGIVQGGIITTLADFAAVYAAMSYIPAGHTPAVRLDISCLRPVKAGDVMTASARVVTETETRGGLTVQVTVRRMDGKYAAYGTITFSKPKL